jgi:glycerol-1-phosphate dehydrogenase [NAD(P)+]
MDAKLPETIDIGPGATTRLASFCARKALGPLRIVADADTYRATGGAAEAELRASGLPVRVTVFPGPGLAAEASSILRLLVDDDPRERTYLAVGSGTITDIVRFVAHRTGRDFVCLATAPSVDAYSSIVAPIVVEGSKRTFPAAAPIAIFADPEVLARAPAPMVAAGFGDVLCKLAAVADWRLGALLWGEGFDEAIAARSAASARSVIGSAEGIGERRPEEVGLLMAALVESGLCMALAGHSRPASGAEHQYSHFWEMRLLAEGRPPLLHGLKVGIGTIESARLWDLVRAMGREEAAARLARTRLPSREEEERKIRSAYGAGAEEVLATQARFLALRDGGLEALRRLVAGSWEAILEIAARVPGEAETRRLLARAGCPTEARELGLGRGEIKTGLECAHYLRDRLTIKKLALLLGLR